MNAIAHSVEAVDSLVTLALSLLDVTNSFVVPNSLSIGLCDDETAGATTLACRPPAAAIPATSVGVVNDSSLSRVRNSCEKWRRRVQILQACAVIEGLRFLLALAGINPSATSSASSWRASAKNAVTVGAPEAHRLVLCG